LQDQPHVFAVDGRLPAHLQGRALLNSLRAALALQPPPALRLPRVAWQWLDLGQGEAVGYRGSGQPGGLLLPSRLAGAFKHWQDRRTIAQYAT
jgi:hypothetical protein